MSSDSADGGKEAMEKIYSGKKQSLEHVEGYNESNAEFDDSIEDTKPSRAVWLITFTVAMGGFLFGMLRYFLDI